MKRSSKDVYLIARSSGSLLLLLLILSACSTYSPSRSYPPRSYVYQPQVNSPYHSTYRYYGAYQPGWFAVGRYPGAYYGVGYGPMAYWPTYAYSNHYYSNYSSYYYPYYDYSRSFYYRPVYGPVYGYNPYYRQGNYGYRPYYGGSHSYRPPGKQERPSQGRPDPVVIPRDQRGDRGPGNRGPRDDYIDEVADRQRQSEIRQPERRSTTVVTQPYGMTRSVSVAPAGNGDQGMVVSSREERKVTRSRLEPVAVQPGDGFTTYRSSGQKSSNRAPVQPVNPAIPVTRMDSPRVYGSARIDSVRISPSDISGEPSRERPPQAASSSFRRMEQAPAPRTPANQQQPSRSEPPPRSEPGYPVQLDSGNVTPSSDRRQQRGPERGQQQRDRGQKNH